MRYIICGAGSVGGVIGARLFEQGSDVVFIARGDHLAVIQRSGLVIESPLGSTTLRVRVVLVAHLANCSLASQTIRAAFDFRPRTVE
jgi:ketopantoate reductase